MDLLLEPVVAKLICWLFQHRPVLYETPCGTVREYIRLPRMIPRTAERFDLRRRDNFLTGDIGLVAR
jgi:hypothetical protein